MLRIIPGVARNFALRGKTLCQLRASFLPRFKTLPLRPLHNLPPIFAKLEFHGIDFEKHAAIKSLSLLKDDVDQITFDAILENSKLLPQINSILRHPNFCHLHSKNHILKLFEMPEHLPEILTVLSFVRIPKARTDEDQRELFEFLTLKPSILLGLIARLQTDYSKLHRPMDLREFKQHVICLMYEPNIRSTSSIGLFKPEKKELTADKDAAYVIPVGHSWGS